MNYICEKCNKSFSRKSHYTQHINRKNSCVEEEKVANKSCEYCNKFFSRKDRLIKHMNSCEQFKNSSKKLSELSELKQIIIDTRQEFKEQIEEIKIIKQYFKEQIEEVKNILHNKKPKTMKMIIND